MATTFTSMIDLVYPVNSIYLSWSSSFSPASSFGGTWSRLTAEKMLRTGTGNATGGDDAHSHVIGLMYVDFWGALTYPDNSSYNLLTCSTFPEIDSGLGDVTHNTWTSAHILSRNAAAITGPWTNKGAYNAGGYYYTSGGTITTSFGMTSKNIPYKRFSADERNYLTTNVNSSGNHFYGLNGSVQTTIPAYQTINTWRRTA